MPIGKGTHTHNVMINIILLVTCIMSLFLAQLWKLSLPVDTIVVTTGKNTRVRA